MEGEFIGENVDKIMLAEVMRISSPINFNGRYMQTISNIDINTTKNLELTDMKKYWRCTSQISEEVKELNKNQILVLSIFVSYLR